MHDVAFDLLVLLAGVWIVAVTLRPLGLPTIMGELIVGVLVGPAVLGIVAPSEAITLLAEIGIFFLMFHAGVETQPGEFFHALRRSLGVALVGAAVPFVAAFSVATAFGLSPVGATFVGLTMTATAVVITVKALKDLGLADTRVARVIVASCVIDDLLTLVVFGILVGVLTGGSFEASDVALTLVKVVAFFGVAFVLGRFVYPRLSLPFRTEGGKGFTFILLVAFAAGLLAEAIGLHMIIGAYLAGLFFEEKVAHPNLVRVVADRSYGIAYSFLGPIFFMSLGFSITFDLGAAALGFLAVLTSAVVVGQILSAGGMALRMGLSRAEALTVGVGMCGRAELAMILAALALAQNAVDAATFSVLIFTAFLLNLFTPLALKGCSVLLAGRAVRAREGTLGVLIPDKFRERGWTERVDAPPPSLLPDLRDAVVVFGAGPAVAALLAELLRRAARVVVVVSDPGAARRLRERGHEVVLTQTGYEALDLAPLAAARSLVLNASDATNAVVALGAREFGYGGPIIALLQDPRGRAPLLLAGADVTFAPTHVLAAVLGSRASARITPRVTGFRPLRRVLEVVEMRLHEGNPLTGSTLAEQGVRARTGAHVVGRWQEGALRSPPGADDVLEAGTILVAAGTPDGIAALSRLARPVREEGTIVVVGRSGVATKVSEILRGVDERVCVVGDAPVAGVDVAGDLVDPDLLERLPLADARVIVLALGSDTATVFAATVLRERAPDVPILAGVAASESVPRLQRAGADYAVSLGQVAGQLLAHHVLGETVSLQPRIRLVRVAGDPLGGRTLEGERIRERTGCTVVAAERGGALLMELGADFAVSTGDVLYVCGTSAGIDHYLEEFPGSLL